MVVFPMKRSLVAGVFLLAVLWMAGTATAQERLSPQDTVVAITDAREWLDADGRLTFEPVETVFLDEAGNPIVPTTDGPWRPQGAVAVSYAMGPTFQGPSLIMRPGFYAGTDMVYAGVDEANDLATSQIRGVSVQTDSMKQGCEGVRREVALSVSRPGMDVLGTEDEFVGNPGIGHNLQVAFALNDCVPEAFYLELAEGQFQSFQTRVGVLYKDDGEVTTVTFIGGPPTFDGEFSVSAFQSQVPFAMETTYGLSTGGVQWPDDVPFPANLPNVTIADLEQRVFRIMDPPDRGQETSQGEGTPAGDETTSTVRTGEATGESSEEDATSSNAVLFFLVGGLFMVFLLTLYAWFRRRVKAAAPFVPDWLFPADGRLSLIDSQGVRAVSQSDVDELMQKHPLAPVGAVRTSGDGVRNVYAVTTWAHGTAIYPGRDDVFGGTISKFFILPREEGESTSDWLERSRKTRELIVELAPMNLGDAHGRIRGWHQHEVTFAPDDDGNLITTTDLRPPMSGDAESVEIWVSTNQKVIILTEEDPITVFRLVDRLGEQKPEPPSAEEPIVTGDEVTPS